MLISLQSTMESITTTKGKPALIFDGRRFTLNGRMDNGVHCWRCAKRTSPARITTEGNDLKQQTAPYNHAVHVYSSYTIYIYFSHYLYLLLQVWSSDTCTKVRPNGPFHILLDLGPSGIRQSGNAPFTLGNYRSHSNSQRLITCHE